MRLQVFIPLAATTLILSAVFAMIVIDRFTARASMFATRAAEDEARVIAELILLLGYIMLTSIVSLATLGLGCVLSVFLVFGWVGILALHVVAIVKGINGGRLIIPGLSEYANRL